MAQLQPPEKVAVYTPDGKKEHHFKPNARDLVNGAGYSWQPNMPSQPAAFAPFKPSKSARTSQDVLDSVGSQSALLAPATSTEAEVEEDVTVAEDIETTESGEETATGGRRGRRPRGEA